MADWTGSALFNVPSVSHFNGIFFLKQIRSKVQTLLSNIMNTLFRNICFLRGEDTDASR